MIKLNNSNKKPLKVLMLTTYSYEGHHARDLSRGLTDQGIEVAWLSLSAAKTPSWVDEIPILDFSADFVGRKNFLSKIFVLCRILKSYKPDVIQTNLFHAGVIGLISGKIMKIPVIHKRHHIDEHYQAGSVLHRWIDRLAARKSSHVVVCSRATKDWLTNVEGINREHVTVINQGFNYSFLEPSSIEVQKAYKALGFSKSNLNIICVARYSKAKGQEYLLLALKELIKEIPSISITFMGAGESKWLADLVDEFQLSKHVTILPARDDIPACIAASDIVIHPSLADSFSQLIIEVQAVGGLLVATDIAAAREQIVDGKTGIIIEPRSPAAIVEAVSMLVSNPGLAASIRKNGPLHVRREFPWQRMVTEEIDCLLRFVI
jgi:glycosyltransferase involved in cell wall biosynthesis